MAALLFIDCSIFSVVCGSVLQGKPTEASVEARVHKYGELDAKDYIPGAEVLEVTNEDEGWESASLSEENEDGDWIDVHHSSSEEQEEVVGDNHVCDHIFDKRSGGEILSIDRHG
nr:PREDICTED: protein SDA1 homolog [Latimeria chalumnae]|eukprot:XP_006014173.2 PREDICTED: protein SDA1 homolog [Latimeria chalumnae]